jgi:hypothetical protein
MKTFGRVVGSEGQTARVRFCHREFCAGCGHHPPDAEIAEVEVKNPLKASVGDRVEVQSDTGRMLRVMLLVFWAPVLAAALAAWAGWEASLALGWPGTPFAAFCGLIGLGGAGFVVYRVDRSTAVGTGLTITRVVDESHQAEVEKPIVEGGSRAASPVPDQAGQAPLPLPRTSEKEHQ